MDKYRTPQNTAFVSRPNGSSHFYIRTAVIHAALTVAALITFGVSLSACHHRHPKPQPTNVIKAPFGFQLTSGSDQYQIEGFLARDRTPGRLPALLVLNGDRGNARQCINQVARFTSLGLRVACISIPGYGASSGPSRFVGPQSVAAARRALDLFAARGDVDPRRLAVWGLADGAVAAGLLMDSDARPRAIILQSGAYDMLKLWLEAPLDTKLRILRQVWPSKRALTRRSVVENLPRKLDCSVLILHGGRDRKMPVKQAERLARALSARGARVQTYYFPQGSHELGASVDKPLRGFLRDNLLNANPHAAS
jgi:predicted esterase